MSNGNNGTSRRNVMLGAAGLAAVATAGIAAGPALAADRAAWDAAWRDYETRWKWWERTGRDMEEATQVSAEEKALTSEAFIAAYEARKPAREAYRAASLANKGERARATRALICTPAPTAEEYILKGGLLRAEGVDLRVEPECRKALATDMLRLLGGRD